MALLFRALRIHPLRLVWVAALLIAMPQLLAAAPPAHQTASTASQTAEAKTPAEPEPDGARPRKLVLPLRVGASLRGDGDQRRASGLRDAGRGGVQAGAGRRSKLGAAGGRPGRSLLQDRAHQGRGRRRRGPVEEEPGRCGGAHASGAGVSAFAGRHAGHTGW